MSSRAPLDLPTADWTGWLTTQVEERLAAVAAGLDEIRAGQVTGAAVLERWNDTDTALRDAGSLASLLSEVHPDDAVRTLAEDLAQRIDEWRRTMTDRPSRADAVLRLVEAGLTTGDQTTLPSPEKIAQVIR